MLKLEGVLLHKKQVGGKNGKSPLNIVSILDENERWSRVLDLADFDSRCAGVSVGTNIEVPVSIRLNEGKNGESYLNWAVSGEPVVAA